MRFQFRTRAPIWVACFSLVFTLGVPRRVIAQAPTPQELQPQDEQRTGRSDDHPPHPLHQIDDAMVRLPLAAALGAALALRPKRRGTPPRTPAVVQTQIVLAVVGAVVMPSGIRSFGKDRRRCISAATTRSRSSGSSRSSETSPTCGV